MSIEKLRIEGCSLFKVKSLVTFRWGNLCWRLLCHGDSDPVLSLSDPRSRQRLASCLISRARNLDTRHPSSGWAQILRQCHLFTSVDIKELTKKPFTGHECCSISFFFWCTPNMSEQMGGGCFHLQNYSPGSWNCADEARSGPWALEHWPYLGWVRTSDTSVSSNYQTPRPVTSGCAKKISSLHHMHGISTCKK